MFLVFHCGGRPSSTWAVVPTITLGSTGVSSKDGFGIEGFSLFAELNSFEYFPFERQRHRSCVAVKRWSSMFLVGAGSRPPSWQGLNGGGRNSSWEKGMSKKTMRTRLEVTFGKLKNGGGENSSEYSQK